VTSGLLDTSVFVAREPDRPLSAIPDRVSISVVTIGELELGVLAAVDPDVRARRADTLALARQADPIPVTEAVMTAWARLVVTQDNDFDQVASAHATLQVVRV